MEIEVVLDAGATIGESPTWCAQEQALYWIDVRRPALYRHDPARGTDTAWHLPGEIGAFALLADGTGAVTALRQGLFRLDFASGDVTALAAAPFDPALFRFNEGICDAAGRFWVGVMLDPVAGQAPPALTGTLHSFTLGEGLRAEPDRSDLHNGMAWSADGRVYYLSHTKSRRIFAYAVDGLERLGGRRLFAEVPQDAGLPDGAAVDEAGGYWCALHGAGRLRRYTAAGAVDFDIALPVSQPTMCAFAGPTLDDLYVTSAAEGLDKDQEPLAGALLRLRPGIRGIPRPAIVR